MLLQRCLILLSILICYAMNSTAAHVDCMKFPYHRTCRGMQTKRNMDMCNGMKIGSSKRNSIDIGNNVAADYDFEKSRLWAALLEQGINTDVLYNAYASAVARNNGNNRRVYESKDELFENDY